MFESVCAFPLSDDLFAQAIHPTESIIAVGLASGHVQTLRLPPRTSSDGPSSDSRASPVQGPVIETLWRTRRHKGSCRSLAYSNDGSQLVSTGLDGLVKIASAETGQVVHKIAVPAERGELVGSPSLLHVLSPESLILATDTSAVHLYDTRTGSLKQGMRPQQTLHPHDDYVSSLTPLPPTEASTSGFSKQWVTTGGTTLAVSDLRRGVLAKSEDQEEELLCSTIVRGLPRRGTSVGEKVVIGGADGVLTLWEKGVWDDQDERITVDGGRGGGESLDVLTTVPKNVGTGHEVLVGMGNGRIKVVQIGMNTIVTELVHDEIEGVTALGFDAENRAISGGGQILKVWEERMEEDEVSDEEDSDMEDDDEDSGSGEGLKHDRDESGSDDDGDSDESDKSREKNNKKQKRATGSINPHGNHGILAFKGLD